MEGTLALWRFADLNFVSSIMHIYIATMTSMAAPLRIQSPRRKQLPLRQRSSRIVFIGTGSLFVFWYAVVWRLIESNINSATTQWQQTMPMEHHRALPVETAVRLPKKTSGWKVGSNPKTDAGVKKPDTASVGVSNSNDSQPAKEQEFVDIHCTNCTKYLVFKPIPHGQGSGQAMNGLLAAHLLGMEFNRVVCVAPNYTSFLQAFEPVLPQAIQECHTLKLNPKPDLIPLINYHSAPDECVLTTELSSDNQIVYIVGNTYPGWREVPDNYFTRFYKPTPTLKSILPWSEPPSTVVHLRKGDRPTDPREGLDTKTLKALGKALPSDTFLVANNVNWFDFFSEKYGWRHPNWRAVRHSAFRSFMGWGNRGELTKEDESAEAQDLQMWSDWYSILCAKKVWHTHSDFSLSAIHWMNVESKTITGVDESGDLQLIDESWRREPLAPPLVDRRKEDLTNCRKPRMRMNAAAA